MPNSKTCLKTIYISENYDDNEMDIFYEDLKQALIFGINDGFND
jgi:hypothetical protein